MPAAIILTNKFNRYMGLRAGRAMDIVEEAAQVDPITPVDTGKLGSKVRVINRFIAAPRYRANITARALSKKGADYAAILEVAPRIAPRRAKYLAFEVGGKQVFSKGFDNRHYRWWTRLLSQRPSIWRKALIQAGNEVKY